MGSPGIYVGLCIVTDKVYVGSSHNTETRIKSHLKNLKLGKHGNLHLQNSYNKYGSDSFIWKVVEGCEPDTRLVREQWWIEYLQASNSKFGFNVMHTVRTLCPSPRRAEMSRKMWSDPAFKEKTSAKISAAWNTPEHLAWLSTSLCARWEDEEYRASQSAMMTEIWQRPEYQAKIREQRRLMWKNPEYRAKISAIRQATGATPEYKAKQSQGTKSRWDDPEYKERLAATQKAAWADPEKRAKRLAGQAAGRARRAARKEIV